jgi:ATP-dependent Clp protease ATP-binding subunit ClpC
MFDRLTERARKVISLARQEAQRFNHEYVGTEHLLLGLVKEGSGVAANVLKNIGVELKRIRLEVEKMVKSGPDLIKAGSQLPFTPRAKKVLELSLEEARHLGHNYVGTEHILLGLLKEEEGVAARVLQGLGLRPDDVREEVLNLLGATEAHPGEAPPRTDKKEKSKTPALDSFGRDLTQLAREQKLDPVIGRESEIERVTQVLSRRTKNNPVLLGEAGVGKTAIVEGFAQQVVEGNVPDLLRDRRIVVLDLALMVAGTKYRGQFEERIKAVMNEVRRARKVILFIDELHTLVGAGGAEGAIDAANVLKPALSRGEIQCIGATTLDEYRKYVEKDGALERRFQTIMVDPPSKDEALEILRGLRDKYEAHHRVSYTDPALRAAVELSSRYITGRFLPDKAIDVIDESGARVRLKTMTRPPDVRKLEESIQKLAKDKEEAVAGQDFERAAGLRDQVETLRKELDSIKTEWKSSSEGTAATVDEEVIAHVVSHMTGVPLTRMEAKEAERLLRMEDDLHGRVVSQHEAITAVAKAIRRSRSGLKDPKRPMGSFLFLGPTGVGKTLLAKALADFMFGSEDSLIQIDMSEYMEKHNVSRLIGAPPGYVGYEEGGQLTEKIRRRPYAVVLLDELEKAHPDVFNMLLQIMEEGKLTDSFGRNDPEPDLARLPQADARRHLRDDEGAAYDGGREGLPARVPEPARRRHRLPHAHEGGPEARRGLRAVPRAKAGGRPRHAARADGQGKGVPDREGLQPGLRRAASQALHLAVHRGPAVRGDPSRQPRRHSGSPGRGPQGPAGLRAREAARSRGDVRCRPPTRERRFPSARRGRAAAGFPHVPGD